MNGQNLPPSDVSPSDLLLKLLERPQPSEVVDFPARSTNDTPLAQIRVMVLRMEQHDEARIRAREALKTKRRLSDDDLRSPFGLELLGDATARELLAMACVMADPIPGTAENQGAKYARLFRSSDDVNKLTADEVTALFGAYMLVQKRFGPYERDLDDAEVNAWITRLEEGASALPLSRLPSLELAELCRLLAVRASCLSRLLDCQRKNSPIPWESIPQSYRLDTTSSSAPAADATQSPGEHVITAEEAMEAAKRVIGR